MSSNPLSARRGMAGIAAVSLAVLALSGCGQASPAAAAVVNGTIIPKSDVDAIAHDLMPLMKQGQTPKKPVLLMALVLEKFVTPIAKAKGSVVSAEEAKQMIKGEVADPSPQTVRFAQVQKLLQSLDEKTATQIKKDLDAASIEINPRYGTFDRKTYKISPTKSNWMSDIAEPIDQG